MHTATSSAWPRSPPRPRGQSEPADYSCLAGMVALISFRITVRVRGTLAEVKRTYPAYVVILGGGNYADGSSPESEWQ
jgi:hypothetical protein